MCHPEEYARPLMHRRALAGAPTASETRCLPRNGREGWLALGRAREHAQRSLIDEHSQRIARAEQDFEDELGFSSDVCIEEIRAKEGNFRIPLHGGGEAQEQTDAATAALPEGVMGWQGSSAVVGRALP